MKKTIIFLFALAFLSVSCDDFLDVNDNPNDPAISTPSLTLPVAQQSFVALNARTMTTLGNYLVVNWSTPSNWSANAIYSRYNFTSSDFTTIFETSYAGIFKDLTYVETYEDATGAVDYSYYKAICKIIKGFQYQLLVDLYGDVPYTEANLRGENTTPAYDDAETVYKSVIEDLAVAVDLIQNAPDNAVDPGTQDIIYGGDMDHWVEFANTIKLRMLVRLSNTGQDSYITNQIASIDANGGGYITGDVAANPGYSSSANKQQPFWDYYRTAVTGIQNSRGDYTVASEYAITYLETTTNDPRLSRLYAPASASGAFKGTQQITTLPGTGFTSEDVSKVGPGLLVSAEEDQVVMTLSEALFIQAEAVVRGYISGGDSVARDLYESAIEASFDYLGVTTDAEDYYDQPILNVSWDNSPNKIEAIITQKWVALNGTSSIESWIDLTRTGYPSGLPIPVESPGTRPVRLLYPSSEIARNSDNVPAQSSDDVFTNYPFWK
ncbi:SusD/RagB family nutrient-binding outer membrane lipoprotein [Aestuariibaculum sp. L182]|uniref:SusD/RagB family nutrient-binding outer membrane lipoprotein n=2 Tax=Aestuariibaculum lutulentum TaxID=2920935 RepID=A0ABS9RF08_9FLAO|nr:SusD/RagB family nutrient-binding outer membrane lipoprotein [Aestuariibaculum lutulentum]